MIRPVTALLALLLAPVLGGQTGRLTGYEEMMSRLRRLDASSPRASLEIIGRSAQGRDIPALFLARGPFAGRRGVKPMALVFCQQHGDEPSGMEAALLLAAELARGDRAILDRLDLILVPCANPDGAELRQRRNARDRDLNRDHVLLGEPETQALHRLFQEWFPEIVLDVHEYGAVSRWWVGQGMIRDADEMLGALSNLNIDAALRAFAQDVVFPAVRGRVAADGYALLPYVVGSPAEGDRLRFSTNDIDDGRQGLGIYNTLAFILEGKRYGAVDNMLERRAAAQLSAVTAFLREAARRAPEILARVGAARARLLAPVAADERAYVRMDYFPDPARPSLAFPVFNLEEWRAETREWKNFEPLVKVKKSVRVPLAYVVPGGETALIDLLRRHQVRLRRLTAPAEALVETYRVLHAAARLEEESVKPEFDLEAVRERVTLSRGDVLAFLPQRARLLLPLLLEPESSWGIMTDTGGQPSGFASYGREGGIYPVRRLMENADLPLEELD